MEATLILLLLGVAIAAADLVFQPSGTFLAADSFVFSPTGGGPGASAV